MILSSRRFMKTFLIFLMVVFVYFSCSENLQTKQPDADPDIRGIFCQIKNGDYAGAQNNLEKILQKDPQNIYARRLWPGVLAHQIKKDDKSPGNIAQIRKTIE